MSLLVRMRAARNLPGICRALNGSIVSTQVARRTFFTHPKMAYTPARSLGASLLRTSRRKVTGSHLSLICSENPLGWATSVTPHSTASDPAEVEALRCLEQGTAKLEEGDVQAAKDLYQRSAEIKRNASSLFNLGVTHYHLSGLICNSK